MGIVERKKREQQNKKKQILAAAMDLFLVEGFENVTMRKIAERIEYSPGTIYLYFKNKDDIFFELRNEGFEKYYQEQLKTRHIKDPKERLRAHAHVYLEFVLKNPEYYELMFMMKAPMERVKENPLWMQTLKSYELGKEDIRALIGLGLIKEEEAEILSTTIWSLLHGMASLYLRNRFIMHAPNNTHGIIINALDNFLDRLLRG